MFGYKTPEKMGIASGNIEKYLRKLEARRLSTHDVIIMRGENIVFENYWQPFDKDFMHRMYSVSKSILSIAVGFAIQEGYFALDDKITDLLPEDTAIVTDENMRGVTVRDMLMMSTAKTPEEWFSPRHPDRVKFYFENKSTVSNCRVQAAFENVRGLLCTDYSA